MLSVPASPPLPLALHARVNTTDFDEAAETYSRFVTPVRLTRTARRLPFSWRGNALAVGSVGLTASELLGGVSAASDAPVSEYHLAIPLGEAVGMASAGRGEFPMISGRWGFVSSPGQVADVQLQPGFRALGLSIPGAALAEAMGTLTGVPRTVRFERTLALDTPRTAGFRELLRELVACADREPPTFAGSPAAARLSEALLLQLLLGHAHSEAGVLSAQVQAAEPRYVRRAAAYLEAHLASPITMAELVRETGVSVRSLQLGFVRHRGCSPLQFLQTRRLQRARVLLLCDDTLTGVSQAALMAGFQHMGRFSFHYRQRFGETPTSTLSHRRRRGHTRA